MQQIDATTFVHQHFDHNHQPFGYFVGNFAMAIIIAGIVIRFAAIDIIITIISFNHHQVLR